VPAEIAEAEGFPPFVPTEGLWRFSLGPQVGTTDGEAEEVGGAGGKDETTLRSLFLLSASTAHK
jgi:hypothetical protein